MEVALPVTAQFLKSSLFRRFNPIPNAVWFALLGILEILIYFRQPQHFFIRDSLTWLTFRYRSLGEFIGGFFHVDPGLWYRPLTQRTLDSVLFPLAGLNPIPYHVCGFILFFSCTFAVYRFVKKITESTRTAWLATLFFALQVINTFITYDPAFTPEMVYTLFSIGTAIAYVSYLRNPSRGARIASLLWFTGSLLSKETAVALPFALLAISLLLGTHRVKLRSVAPYFVLLSAYLIFGIGYVHIRNLTFEKFWGKQSEDTGTNYQLVFGRNVLDNGRVALSWAFNIPASSWRLSSTWMLLLLKSLRVVVCAAAFFLLFTPHRKFVLLGLIWFYCFCAPTLPLLNHFLPHYLFAPLVGFSLTIGVILNWIYEQTARSMPSFARPGFVVLFAALALVTANGRRNIAEGAFLGGDAQDALNKLNDVRSAYPRLPKHATLVLFDEESPLDSWDHQLSSLFQMGYGDDSIRTQYTSNREVIDKAAFDAGTAFAFKLQNSLLIDVTSLVKERRDPQSAK